MYSMKLRKGVSMLDQIQKGWKTEMGKLEELISATKLNDFLKKNEEQEKKKTVILWVFAIVGAVAAVAAIAYAVFRFLTPDYLEDFEDDFDDDFDDDFFEDDDDELFEDEDE